MEYKIKRNDYVKPTEIRKWVVQALLDCSLDAEICPNQCWRRKIHIGKNSYGEWNIIGENSAFAHSCTEITRLRTCEIREFFKVWINSGYFIHKSTYTVRSQTAILYKFHKHPIFYDWKLVTEFTEDID